MRQGAGEELRADAEENERLAAQAARRNASLADVARDAMFRGDKVALRFAEHTVSGQVVHASGDLVTIEGAAGTVHVNLGVPVTLTVVESNAGEGRTPEQGVDSLRARLFELELAETEVELRAVGFDGTVRGRVAVVATDHVVLRTGDGNLHVAFAAVESVLER